MPQDLPEILLNGNEPGFDPTPIESVTYPYSYYGGLDLHPTSALHKHLIKLILRRAEHSRSVLQNRFDSWEEIDKQLMVYVDADKESQMQKALETKAPVAVVVPTLFATMDTLLTYLMNAFLEEPIFRYEGVEPNDMIGAVLLENLINFQTRRNRIGLNLHTQWRDCLAYGIGSVSVGWEIEKGYLPGKETIYFKTPMGNIPIGKKTSSKEGVVFEGNVLNSIDPWNYLPDPNVGIHEVQKGEFCGWIDQISRIDLLEQEANSKLYMNCRYLKHIKPVSGSIGNKATLGYIDYKRPQRKLERTDSDSFQRSVIRPVQRVHMYVHLIPSEWGLGASEKPEKWYFCVADRQLLIAAKPMGLRHNRYPIAVAAPHYDGRTIAPVSMLEQIYGMADFTNWLFNSKSLSVRKSLNGITVLNPNDFEMDTVYNPGPGGMFFIKNRAWGKQPKDLIHQLNVGDPTAQHIPDIAAIVQMIEGVTATDRSFKGQMRSGPDRVTAEESRGVRRSGLGRSGKTAKLISMQSMSELAYFFAAHTQQFMTQETYVRISGGRWEEDMRREAGTYDQLANMAGRTKVTPLDISVNWDVYPHDATITTGENAQTMIQFMQLSGQLGAIYPQLPQTIDIVRMYMAAAREAGFKNVQQFVRTNAPLQMNMMPPEQVENKVKTGDIVPWQSMNAA